MPGSSASSFYARETGAHFILDAYPSLSPIYTYHFTPYNSLALTLAYLRIIPV